METVHRACLLQEPRYLVLHLVILMRFFRQKSFGLYRLYLVAVYITSTIAVWSSTTTLVLVYSIQVKSLVHGQVFLDKFFLSRKTCPCVRGHLSSFRLSSLTCWKAGVLAFRQVYRVKIWCAYTRASLGEKNLSMKTCPSVRGSSHRVYCSSVSPYKTLRYLPLVHITWDEAFYYGAHFLLRNF